MDRAELTSLAWALADVAKPFTRRSTRVWLHAAIGAGEIEGAITSLLQNFSRNHTALPIELAAQLRRWIAGYAGSDTEQTLQGLAATIPVHISDGPHG